MKRLVLLQSLFTFALVGLSVGLLMRSASAQLHPPEIRSVYPLGGSRGMTTRVTIGGVSFRNAAAILFDRPGVTAKILPSDPKSLPAAALESDGNPPITADVTVAPDAAPGLNFFRAVSPAGVSNIGKWSVGRAIPAIEEQEPNDDTAHAQALTLPVAVNGHIGDGGDRDTFAFALEAGKTFVAEVTANRANSPLDSLLILRDADGREVASNDDYNGPDSLLVYAVPKSGRYVLTLASSVQIGGPDYAYRLSLGALPLLYAVYPISVEVGKASSVEAIGINVPARVPLRPLSEARGGLLPTAVADGMGSNALPVALAGLPTVKEQEPNDDAGHATPLPAPGIANGQFWRRDGKPGEDIDFYKFHAEAGRRFLIDAQCQALGSRGDPTLQLLDSKGKLLMENDDAAGRDLHLDFTAPAAGDYYLRIKDVAGRSAPDLVYRLILQDPPPPNFYLATETRGRGVGQGDAAPFEVTVERDRFDGPVTLSVADLPPGVTATSTVVPAGVTRGLLVLTAAPAAPLGAFPLHIVGTAQVNGRNVRQPLTRAADWVWKGGPRTSLPTPSDFTFCAVVVPFEVAPKTDVKEASVFRNNGVKVKVRLERRVPYNKPVTLRALGLPDGVTAADVILQPNVNEVELEIKAAPMARLGSFPIVIDAVSANSPTVQVDRITPVLTLTVSDPPQK